MNSRCSLGRALAQAGRFGEAIEHCEAAVDIACRLEEPLYVTSMVEGLVEVLIRAGRLERAVAEARRGLRMATRTQHGLSVAGICRQLGDIHERRGEHGEALVMFRRAVQEFESTGATAAAAVCRVRIVESGFAAHLIAAEEGRALLGQSIEELEILGARNHAERAREALRRLGTLCHAGGSGQP
jgi:tetratricopeptide (TPR) repeat protein